MKTTNFSIRAKHSMLKSVSQQFCSAINLIKYETLKSNSKIGILTLNNPKKRNALSYDLLQQFNSQIARIKKEFEDSSGNKSSIIILAGEGPVFSSGHDLKEISGFDKKKQEETFKLCGEICLKIRESQSIFVSEIHGLATAAGLQLALACDLAFASNQSNFSTPGIKVGLSCTTPSVELARHVTNKRAMHMLLTGEMIDSETALNWGIINDMVSINKGKDYNEHREILRTFVIEYCTKLTKLSSQSLSFGKKAFNTQVSQSSSSEAYRSAICSMVANIELPECKEGVKAFMEKRKPEFKH